MGKQSVFQNKPPQKLEARGMILVSVLILSTILMMIGFSLISAITGQYRLASDDVYTDNALLAAEAGVEQSVEQLNQSDSFAGYPTPQTLFNDQTQGFGQFVATISASPDDTNAKIITSTGTIYHYGQTTDPVSIRKVKVTVVGTASAGYSVSTGPGGLILGGSASITNSSVYVNGTITMTGTSSIGTQTNPVTVDAGNIACPKGSSPGSTYPTLCSDGNQPLSLAFSTKIWGTVCATGQTSTGPNNNIKGGNGGLGLQVGCTAPTVSQPVYDRAGIIGGMATTASGTSGAYVCNGNKSVTLPANVQLTGTSVSWGNSCTLTISGNVYIPGNLSIGGAVKIKVADSLGTTRPVVVVDGTVDVGGSASMIANSSGAGIDFVSFKNATGDPASTPTGTNLYNSQSQQNVTVGGAVSLAGMIFDAYWSEVALSGSGNIGAAAGQTVNLSGAGTVIFGTTLSSGSKTWTITSYQQLNGSS